MRKSTIALLLLLPVLLLGCQPAEPGDEYLVQEILANHAESMYKQWDWFYATSVDPVAEYAATLPALTELLSRDTCAGSMTAFGIPLVEELLQSESYDDHKIAVSFARLICAVCPEAAEDLRSIPSPYRDMTDEELVRGIADHELIQFFYLGSAPVPLSDEGVSYFSTMCPELAALMGRENFTESLAEYGAPLSKAMQESEDGGERLDGGAFGELIVWFNHDLQEELGSMFLYD